MARRMMPRLRQNTMPSRLTGMRMLSKFKIGRPGFMMVTMWLQHNRVVYGVGFTSCHL